MESIKSASFQMALEWAHNNFMLEGKMPKFKRPQPTISLEEVDLPAIKNWEVGKTYNIKAKVKMTFQSKGDEWESPEGVKGQNKMRARFKILSIQSEKEPKKKLLPRKKYE